MSSNEVFKRAALQIQPGEWTTYGDISAAATGTTRSARLVGMLAAADELPNAHRVLTSEGRVSRPGGATDRPAHMLTAEGVTFRRKRADPRRRIHWDELRRRMGEVARRNG